MLIEKTDDECVLLSPLLDAWLTICSWWKVKAKGDTDGHGGLVPAAYVEPVSTRLTVTTHSHENPLAQAEHSSVVKAQYDYDAVAQGELSLKEEQTLLVFGEEEDGWLLVQEQDGGKVGYVPGNYVEVVPPSILSHLTLR